MERIDDILDAQHIEFSRLNQKAAWAVEKQWLETFAEGVKQARGTYVYGGEKWRTFTDGFHASTSGQRALARYKAQSPSTFFIFGEDLTFAASCTGRPPLLTSTNAIYVVDGVYRWTMAFTHEDDGFAGGPFFAMADPPPDECKLMAAITPRR